MAKNKKFTSKNLTSQIESLLKLGKQDLVVDILKAKELQGLLPNILKTLRKKSDKQADLAQTKIFSKTNIDEELLKKLEKTLSIDTKNAKIIIDKNLGAGMIIKSGGLVVDASLETMLEKEIAKII